MKGAIDGHCKYHNFEFRVPRFDFEINGLDTWLESDVDFAEVQRDFPQFFGPQLTPAAGGESNTDILDDASDISTLVIYHHVLKKVYFRDALGVSLPWLFRALGMHASGTELIDMFYTWPIVHLRRDRGMGREAGGRPAAGGNRPAAGGNYSWGSDAWQPNPKSQSWWQHQDQDQWWQGGWQGWQRREHTGRGGGRGERWGEGWTERGPGPRKNRGGTGARKGKTWGEGWTEREPGPRKNRRGSGKGARKWKTWQPKAAAGALETAAGAADRAPSPGPRSPVHRGRSPKSSSDSDDRDTAAGSAVKHVSSDAPPGAVFELLKHDIMEMNNENI